MSLPIRAFLMVRLGPDDWSVEVCRDFDAVLAAWQRRPLEAQPAVLHVGFDRPPSTAFSEIASAFPGRMLFTAAARYGVPEQFESSELPVGFVGGLPIHLALRGWGYTEAEISIVEAPAYAPRDLRDWSDWLIGFTDARPEFIADLSAAGVFAEASYLANEATLSWEARYRAGLYRYGHLISGEDDDPCAMARAAPPWLRGRKLEDIDLTVRLRNVFDRASFFTVADIGNVALNDLYGMSNFGRKSDNDLKRILREAMAQGPRNGGSEQPGASASEQGSPALATLLAELHRTLALCEPRERDILVRRMGLECEAETLQSVSDDYGITRERIRQIEAKSTKRIIRQENWDDVLAAKMERLLANRDYPLPVLGLEAVDGWFAGVSSETTAFGYLLANFCGDRVSIIEIAGVQYIGFLTTEEWNHAVSEGIRVLKYAGDKGWTDQHVRSLLLPALPEKSREFRSLLWDELSKQCHFSTNIQGETILVSFGRGIESAIEAVLVEAESPLHYSEIAQRLEARLAKPVDVRRAHNAAANVGILLGRGVFGLERHIDVAPTELDRIADEASGIILSGATGRQWHSAELLGGLIERGFTGSNFNKYVVDYALRRSGGLTRLGRMAWSAKETAAANERIEIRDAMQSLVFEAGRPLTTAEIRQRLVALRGVNDSFQFSFSDPLLRVGTALWGLNDRDVPIARRDQPALIDHLIEKLEAEGRGIHISEVAATLDQPWREITPQIVLSIGALDDRLRVSVGQFLYLTEWGEPRRETIFQIVQRLVDRIESGFTTADIVQSIEMESTLRIDTSQVSACIRSAGATFDSASRCWLIDRQFEDVEMAG